MTLEIYTAFFIAASIILIIPGPTIILVVSQAIAHGRRSVIPLVAGVLLGDFTAMTLSLLGLGAVLAASATIFTVLKWIGALYLIYLGVTLWRSNPSAAAGAYAAPEMSAGGLFKSAYIVTALNPKSIAFFVAFLPQFVSAREALMPQLSILGATFLILATINAALYAIFAGYLRDALSQGRIRKWFNRCGGCALIGAGVITATMRRAS